MSHKNGVDKACRECGALYYVQAHRAEKSEFCSMECLWKGRKVKERKTVSVICIQCYAEFTVPSYRKETAKFCSGRCGMLFRKRSPEFEAHRLERSNASKTRQPEEVRLAKKAAGDKRYHEENKAEKNAKSRAYYSDNKVSHAAKSKIWREKNAERISQKNREKREKNGDAIRAKRRQHYADNKPRYVAQARMREEIVKRATPPWADFEKIAEFYAESARLTAETGIVHHVDHIIPLQGKMVCGLHVHTNLQVIPKLENLRKSNRV